MWNQQRHCDKASFNCFVIYIQNYTITFTVHCNEYHIALEIAVSLEQTRST